MDYFSTNQMLKDEARLDCLEHQQRLAQILLSAIPVDRRQSWAGKVLIYLAEQTLRFTRGETETWSASTKAIHMDLGGNSNQEPSAWLSPIWKEIETRRLPEITPVLMQACAAAGLDVYPIVIKENGKPAYYRLGSVPLSDKTSHVSGEDCSDSNQAASVLVYKRDLSLRLSMLGRLLFRHPSNFGRGKRFSFLTGHVLLLAAVLCFEVLVFLLLGLKTQPLSAQDLVLLLMGFYVPWALSRYQRQAFRLFEDRIVIAPDWALSWREVGATIEINRTTDIENAQLITVNRYTSVCSVCKSIVKLDRGEPDYPRRLVGRCSESPREHVFSFDRFTLKGERLQ